MNNTLSIGTPDVSVHHMPEAYYEKWERIFKRHLALHKRATRTNNPKDWQAWERVTFSLVCHENAHNTD